MPFNPEALNKFDQEISSIDENLSDSQKTKKRKRTSPRKPSGIKNIGDENKPAENSGPTARFIDYIPKTADSAGSKDKADAHLGEEIPEAPEPGKDRGQMDEERIEKAWRNEIGKKTEMSDGTKMENPEKINEILNQEGIPAGENREETLKRLDEAIAKSRADYAEKDYKATHILARLKNVLKLRTRPGNLRETQDLYNQYQICVNDRLQFELNELKEKNLNPDEFNKEAEKISKYYNQDEKANLYKAHTDARAKVWEEKFGKIPGLAAKLSGKFVNGYRNLNWKWKMGLSIGAGLTGAGFLIMGQRIVGGAASGVGIHGAMEGRYRKKEEARLQAERGEMIKGLEGVEGQEQKCEALMQMLQNEVGGFQKDLQRERKGARNRKLAGATVGALLGSGKLQGFVKWGLSEANAAHYVKAGFVGMVGEKNADYLAEKLGNVGAFLKGAKHTAGEKLHNLTQFGKGIIQDPKWGTGIPGVTSDVAGPQSQFGSEFGKGVVPSYGADVAGFKANLPPEVSLGVVPSHGADVPGGGGNKYYDALKKAYDTKPNVDLSHQAPDLQNQDFNSGGKGMTQFEKDVRHSDLAKGGRPGGGGDMTQFEKDARAGAGARQGFENGRMGGWDPEPIVKPAGPHMEPVGKISNVGFENKTLPPLPEGGSIEGMMIKNGIDPGEAHRTILRAAKAQGISAKAFDLVPPGARPILGPDGHLVGVLSPDGEHMIDFHGNHQPDISRGSTKHAVEHRAPKVSEHASKIPEHAPQPRGAVPESGYQTARSMQIEMENNSLISRQHDLQEQLAKLNKQIAYNENLVKMGQHYGGSGQIHSGPTVEEIIKGEKLSAANLEHQIDVNNARIARLQEEYAKLGSGKSAGLPAEHVPEKPKLSPEADNLQGRVNATRALRQEISGGNITQWNRIQRLPAQEVLLQPNSPVTIYYNYIVQENPRFARFIRPHRHETVMNWTARLADYHNNHSGRFARFNIPHRRY